MRSIIFSLHVLFFSRVAYFDISLSHIANKLIRHLSKDGLRQLAGIVFHELFEVVNPHELDYVSLGNIAVAVYKL